MGFFSKKIDYPELAPDNPAAKQIHAIEGALKELMGQISDPMEVVPAEGCAFVFIGKPPKRFGMAILDDKVHSFAATAREKGLAPTEVQQINDKLRDAYLHCQDAPRFKTQVNGKEVVVTPDAQLEQEVREIMSVIYN